jgi:hypothetical protein
MNYSAGVIWDMIGHGYAFRTKKMAAIHTNLMEWNDVLANYVTQVTQVTNYNRKT